MYFVLLAATYRFVYVSMAMPNIYVYICVCVCRCWCVCMRYCEAHRSVWFDLKFSTTDKGKGLQKGGLPYRGGNFVCERFEIRLEACEILHGASGKVLKLDPFWLRDHCRCTQCFDGLTRQRRYNLLDIPPAVAAVEQTYDPEGKVYKVTWSDGHWSVYDIDSLYASQVDQLSTRPTIHSLQMPWDRADILQNQEHLHVKLSQLVSSEDCVRKLVESLVRYGIVFIDGVPADTTMTEMAIRRVFPVMKTFFGEMYTFSDAPDHADSAYSKKYLGAHTDNTYFCDAAGLQALHCLQHINGEGGENFFVDGLRAALQLRRLNPRAFEVLTRVQVPAEYIESGQHHKHCGPLIRIDPVDGAIVQIRLNIYDRSVFNTISQDQMFEFYESFREFLRIVEALENQWIVKLNPGTVVIFDNWRVCHGRHEYTGQRTMTGCYVRRTDFISKARLLGVLH